MQKQEGSFQKNLSMLCGDLIHVKNRAMVGLLCATLMQQPFAGAAGLPPGQTAEAHPPQPGQLAGPTQDIGWPRQVSRNGAVLVYYQPQIDEWED